MENKVKEEFLKELDNSSLEELLSTFACYINAPDERKIVTDYILANFTKKKGHEQSG